MLKGRRGIANTNIAFVFGSERKKRRDNMVIKNNHVIEKEARLLILAGEMRDGENNSGRESGIEFGKARKRK